MIVTILIYLGNPESKFWGTMVILFIIGLGYLANKLTRGATIDYLTYAMNDSVKKTLVFIHGFGSLLLALLLPNNYLNEVGFINNLYEENQLWIAGTMLILLFSFIIILGITFTLIARLAGLKKIDGETDYPKT